MNQTHHVTHQLQVKNGSIEGWTLKIISTDRGSKGDMCVSQVSRKTVFPTSPNAKHKQSSVQYIIWCDEVKVRSAHTVQPGSNERLRTKEVFSPRAGTVSVQVLIWKGISSQIFRFQAQILSPTHHRQPVSRRKQSRRVWNRLLDPREAAVGGRGGRAKPRKAAMKVGKSDGCGPPLTQCRQDGVPWLVDRLRLCSKSSPRPSMAIRKTE